MRSSGDFILNFWMFEGLEATHGSIPYFLIVLISLLYMVNLFIDGLGFKDGKLPSVITALTLGVKRKEEKNMLF